MSADNANAVRLADCQEHARHALAARDVVFKLASRGLPKIAQAVADIVGADERDKCAALAADMVREAKARPAMARKAAQAVLYAGKAHGHVASAYAFANANGAPSVGAAALAASAARDLYFVSAANVGGDNVASALASLRDDLKAKNKRSQR